MAKTTRHYHIYAIPRDTKTDSDRWLAEIMDAAHATLTNNQYVITDGDQSAIIQWARTSLESQNAFYLIILENACNGTSSHAKLLHIFPLPKGKFTHPRNHLDVDEKMKHYIREVGALAKQEHELQEDGGDNRAEPQTGN